MNLGWGIYMVWTGNTGVWCTGHAQWALSVSWACSVVFLCGHVTNLPMVWHNILGKILKIVYPPIPFITLWSLFWYFLPMSQGPISCVSNVPSKTHMFQAVQCTQWCFSCPTCKRFSVLIQSEITLWVPDNDESTLRLEAIGRVIRSLK